MKFQYSGSMQDLLNALEREIISSKREYRLEYDGNGKLSIGFQRLGHSGGRWFVADIRIEDDKTILVGEFQDIFISSQNEETVKGKVQKFLIGLMLNGTAYLFLFGVMMLIWKFAKLENLLIPIVFPIVVLILLKIGTKPSSTESDRKFIAFMTQVVGCEYSS